MTTHRASFATAVLLLAAADPPIVATLADVLRVTETDTEIIVYLHSGQKCHFTHDQADSVVRAQLDQAPKVKAPAPKEPAPKLGGKKPAAGKRK